jgi:hypothetical protein
MSIVNELLPGAALLFCFSAAMKPQEPSFCAQQL